MRGTVLKMVLGVGAVALGASACGGPGPGPGPARANGLGTKSADAILAAARTAADDAQSVHIVAVKDSGPTQGTSEFDEQMPSTGEANVGLANGQRYTILQVGTTAYVKANATYLDATGATAAQARKLTDRCIQTTIGPSNVQNVGVYASIRQLLTTALTTSGPLTKGSTSTVDGQPVIALQGKGSSTLYVATTGSPYPVELKTSTASVTFSNWGKSVSLVPFSPCETLAQANARS